MRQPLARFVTSCGAAISVAPGALHLHRADALVLACGPALDPLCSASRKVWSYAGSHPSQSAGDWIARYGPVPPGHAIWTSSGNLGVKGLILAVLGEDPFPDPALAARAVADALRMAAQTRCVHLAFPLLGAHVASSADLVVLAASQIRAVFDFIEDHPVESIEEVRFVSDEHAVFASLFNEFLSLFGAGSRVNASLEDES